MCTVRTCHQTAKPVPCPPISLRVECRGNIYLENGIGGSIRAALAAAAHPCTLSTQDLRKSCESAKGRSVKLGDHSSTRVLLRRDLHDPSRDKTTPPSTRALHDVWCPGDAACTQSIPTDRGDLHPFCLQSRILWEIRPSGSFLVCPLSANSELVSPLVWDACVQLEVPGHHALSRWNPLHLDSMLGILGRALFPLAERARTVM